MRAKTSGSSYAQTVARTQPRGDFEYPAGYPDGYFPPPPPPCLCWFYDDGFLMADSGTSDPTSPGFGLTSIWRYDNASQYDPIGETLTFHNRSAGVDGYSYELSAATVIDRPTALSDTFSGQGLESIVGVSGPSSGTVSVDLCVGVSAIWDAEAALLGVTFEEDVIQRRHTVYREYSKTAVHDVSGVTIPSAPYRTIPGGPAIPYDPLTSSSSSRTYSSLSGQWEWTNRNHIDISASTDIYSLWLGPRIHAHAFDCVNVHLTPRLSVNIVDVGVSRYETLTRSYEGGDTMIVHSWADQGSKTDTVFGGGVTAGVDWESAKGFFAGIQGGYEWVADEVTVNVGPNKVSIDISGYTATAVAGFRFGGN